jgi:hypothetical protein
MIVCPYCQAQNADAAAYCIRCGQAVGRAGAVAGGSADGQSKGLAVTSLVSGILSLLGCVGLGSLVAIITGVMAMSRAKNEPHVYGGKGMAVAGVVMGSVSLLILPIFIIAAIAIPSLLRARVSANESAAIGDVRTVISAQVSYASHNDGNYDTLECLAAPGSCIPQYSGPTMLDPLLASGAQKMGYRRTLYLGPPAQQSMDGDPISPSSVRGFAYVAVPIQPGRTGIRGFCGDARGIICATPDGSEADVVDGECQVGPGCPALQ